jgi:hypothetical protein
MAWWSPPVFGWPPPESRQTLDGGHGERGPHLPAIQMLTEHQGYSVVSFVCFVVTIFFRAFCAFRFKNVKKKFVESIDFP